MMNRNVFVNGLIDGLEKLGFLGAGIPILEGKGEHGLGLRPYISLGFPYIISAGLKHTSNLPIGDEYGVHPAIGLGLTGPHIAAMIGKRKDRKKNHK